MSGTGCANQYSGGGWYACTNEPKGQRRLRLQGQQRRPQRRRPRRLGAGPPHGPGFGTAGGGPCTVGYGTYNSTNPKLVGSGFVKVDACDSGTTGPSKGDVFSVSFSYGPYDGLGTGSRILGGNFTAE